MQPLQNVVSQSVELSPILDKNDFHLIQCSEQLQIFTKCSYWATSLIETMYPNLCVILLHSKYIYTMGSTFHGEVIIWITTMEPFKPLE